MNTQLSVEVPQKTDEDVISSEDYMFNGERFLTFVLGGESYAVNILAVNEISGWDSATLIPNSPEYVKGVVNLRGTIVPIVDLRIRFQVGQSHYLPTTVVIILSGHTDMGERIMGFIVDAVSDVLDVTQEDVQSAPDFDGTVPSDYIYGLVNSNENVVTVLDVERLLSMDN